MKCGSPIYYQYDVFCSCIFRQFFFKTINKFSHRRNENHLRYANNLQGTVSFQNWDNNYPVSISFGALAKSKQDRKEIINRLVENGIETRIYSAGNLGRHPFWTNKYGVFEDEMSDRIHQTGFFLPNYPELTIQEVDLISSVVKNQ